MKNQLIPSVCICLVVAGSLFADSTFTGAVSDLWSNPDNWSEGLPDAADKAKFTDGQLCVLDYDAGAVKQIAMEGDGADHLRLVDGAALTVAPGSTDGWAIIGYAGAPEEPHLLEVLGGVFNADHRMKIGFQGKGMLVVDYSGVVNVNAQHFSIGDDTNGDGRVELRGGALNLNDNELYFKRGANSTASIDFSGGVLTWDFTDAGLALINDRIADGTITAYDGVGTVIVERTQADVLVVKGLHPFSPVPADGIIVVPGSTTLEWTVDAGTSVDVWFGTTGDDFTKIVDQQTVTSVQVDTVKGTRYFWAVDTYAPGAADPNLGPLFDFLADNLAPKVDAGADVTTWLENGTAAVALAGAVTDADPTTVAWTVITEPNEATAAIADADQADTTVTLSALGTYVLQLEADDGEYQGSDTITINVFENSCLAAQSLPGYEPLPGDLNGDCVVDQLDIDLLLEQWLNCNGLDCPDIDPVDPNLPE